MQTQTTNNTPVPKILVRYLAKLPDTKLTRKELIALVKARKRGEVIPRKHRRVVRTYRKILKFARAVVKLHSQTGGLATLEKSTFVNESGERFLLISVLRIGKAESSKVARANFREVYGSKAARKAIRKQLASYSHLCSTR